MAASTSRTSDSTSRASGSTTLSAASAIAQLMSRRVSRRWRQTASPLTTSAAASPIRKRRPRIRKPSPTASASPSWKPTTPTAMRSSASASTPSKLPAPASLWRTPTYGCHPWSRGGPALTTCSSTFVAPSTPWRLSALRRDSPQGTRVPGSLPL